MHLNLQKISPNPSLCSQKSIIHSILIWIAYTVLRATIVHQLSLVIHRLSSARLYHIIIIELWAKKNMNSFRAIHTISRRMMTSGVHQPFAIKPKFKVPKSAGMAVSNLYLYLWLWRCACILFIIWHTYCCSVSDYIHTAQLSTSLCTSYLLHITHTAHARYILYLEHRIWKQNCGPSILV